MTRSNQVSYWLSTVLLLVALCLLFFARGLSFWLMLLLTALVAINVSIEFLTRGIPVSLRDLSSCNCRRMDGTISSRRSSQEQRAFNKVRSDLWASFLIVGFIGTAGMFGLQSQFPLKLVPEVVSAALDSSNDFKIALKDRGVDRQFADWSESESYSSSEGIRDRQERLWMTWPVMLLGAVILFAVCIAILRFAYVRSVQEFAIGVNARSAEYLNLDIGRLQG